MALLSWTEAAAQMSTDANSGQTQELTLPRNVVKVSGGVSFVTSKVYMYDKFRNALRTSRWQPGPSISLDYGHFWNSGYGIGFNAIGCFTRYGDGAGNTFELDQWYVGPSVVYNRNFGDHWRCDATLSIGYAHISSGGSDSSNGVGVVTKVGVEYMLSRQIGLGVELTEMAMTAKETNDYTELKESFPNDTRNESYGISNIGLSVGVRLYF